MYLVEKNHIRVGQAEVYYQAAGQGNPLVLLHGLSGSGRWWAKNIQPLARQFRVYVVDLPGFGYSRGQRFVLREASQVITNWLDGIGLAQISIIGHSMGGFIAADLASQQPGRVERLVLVDAAAIPVGRSLVRNAFGLVEALRYVPVDFLPVLVTDALRAGPFPLAAAIRDILRADLTADLSKIELDTLIVWGEMDTLLPLDVGDRLYQALPHASYVIIEGAGHNPMWDRSEKFNEVVTEFMMGPIPPAPFP